ncbi:hypothetical protein BASA81_005397 [Batrachochytrium salamandrivorans]|nr:hypothetical protein BASA81_005397 [Batrachochytrium salamandrivorans]
MAASNRCSIRGIDQASPEKKIKEWERVQAERYLELQRRNTAKDSARKSGNDHGNGHGHGRIDDHHSLILVEGVTVMESRMHCGFLLIQMVHVRLLLLVVVLVSLYLQ